MGYFNTSRLVFEIEKLTSISERKLYLVNNNEPGKFISPNTIHSVMQAVI